MKEIRFGNLMRLAKQKPANEMKLLHLNLMKWKIFQQKSLPLNTDRLSFSIKRMKNIATESLIKFSTSDEQTIKKLERTVAPSVRNKAQHSTFSPSNCISNMFPMNDINLI